LYNFAHQKIGLYPNSVELKSILDDSIEKHIVNDGLFWGIFILSIRLNEFPSFQLKAISESVNRFERCKSKQLLKQAAFGVAEVSDRILNDSIESVGIFSEQFALASLRNFKSKTSLLLTTADKMVQSAIKELRKNLDAEGNIFVYRGFDFGPKDSVRKGLKKTGNKQAHIQETGVGLSFTLDKMIAKEFALSKWQAMHNKDVSWENRVSNNWIILEKSGIDLQKFLSDKERYAAIGTYKVKETDIICNLAYDRNDVKSECEIMILPENLELISYNIITGTKAI
jgi:hypothetical protein